MSLAISPLSPLVGLVRAWIGLSRGPAPRPGEPIADSVFRLANILILIGRRPASGESLRLMTACVGLDFADFASGVPVAAGERLELHLLLFEGSLLRVPVEVAEVKRGPHYWTGRLRFALDPGQRARVLSFLYKMGRPIGLAGQVGPACECTLHRVNLRPFGRIGRR